ncbi:MAG: large repetitive protein [Gaiellales bacterium]|nr:large repetitive protein [Gaiellales bacterium]
MAFLTAGSQAAVKLDIHFVRAPNAISNSQGATLAFSKNVRKGVRSVSCRLDAGAWRKCSRAFVLKNLSEGMHTARVRLVMKNGRSASDSHRWRVDTVAPQAAQPAPDLAWSNESSRTVMRGSFTDAEPASGVARYERRLSEDAGATWASAAGDEDTTVSREGETLVQYRAVDGAGNASAWVETVVRLDRTGPSVPTTTGGSGVWRSAASIDVVDHKNAVDGLSGVAPDGYEMQTRIEGGETWSDTQPDVDGGVTVSGEGVTEVRFRGIDRAGNAGDWSAPALVKLDRSGPTTPTVTGGGAWADADVTITNNADATDALSGIDPQRYEHQTSNDGAQWAEAELDAAGIITVSREGTTLVRFRAHDLAGNAGEWSVPVLDGAGTARIDKTAPTAPGVTGGGAAWSKTPVIITNSEDSTDSTSLVDPAGYEFQTSTDGGASWSTPQADQAHTVTVSTEGITLVRFRSHDRAGNASDWTDPLIDGAGSARIDTTAPAVPAVTGIIGWSKAASVNVAVTSTGDTLGATAYSGLAHYLGRTSLNGGQSYGVAKQIAGTLAVTAEGISDVSAAACDVAGNCSAFSAVSATAKVSIDRTPPTMPVVTGGDGAATCTSYVASQAFTASSTDALSGIHFYQSAGTNGKRSTGVQNGNPRTISATKITGRIQLQFVAIDRAGNVGSWSSLSNPGGIKCIG